MIVDVIVNSFKLQSNETRSLFFKINPILSNIRRGVKFVDVIANSFKYYNA